MIRIIAHSVSALSTARKNTGFAVSQEETTDVLPHSSLSLFLQKFLCSCFDVIYWFSQSKISSNTEFIHKYFYMHVFSLGLRIPFIVRVSHMIQVYKKRSHSIPTALVALRINFTRTVPPILSSLFHTYHFDMTKYFVLYPFLALSWYISPPLIIHCFYLHLRLT